MTTLDDGSVHLVVTSPPYWQLKDYGSDSEIGFNDSYESYINHLNLVWQECFRVLEPGCRLCVNIGDQYARSTYYGRYKVIPIRTEIIKFCETIGFDYMGAIIWQKVATVNTSGGATIMGSFPFPRNGIVKLDYEFILLFKKSITSKNKPKNRIIDPEIKEMSRMTTEEWNTFFYGHWNFPGEKQKKHMAMFPKELPLRLIKMFTFVGDTVLDPFAGSGTTSLAALELNRNSIGYEINPEFIPLIKEKLNVDSPPILYKPQFFFPDTANDPIDFQAEIDKLPYVFKDPIKLNTSSKTVKSKQYGSKIDKNSTPREAYFRIKKILSPSLLMLNDDRHIQLLGIQTIQEKQEDAMAFLEESLTGKKVYLRFDKGFNKPEDFGEGEALPCYLYLKNKTFINAHLIKKGLTTVDESREFKYRKRFLSYAQTAGDNR
jgi:site-specific DNA-methyltransferase (adenine-specific)